ncbi:hypothetical protein GGR57DRAFT_200572 [Xylariaceae sp. FL1272]|nr:hypothetical protein GGR57DRAFT_200572 [Xylariaceae sp. FL1272]
MGPNRAFGSVVLVRSPVEGVEGVCAVWCTDDCSCSTEEAVANMVLNAPKAHACLPGVMRGRWVGVIFAFACKDGKEHHHWRVELTYSIPKPSLTTTNYMQPYIFIRDPRGHDNGSFSARRQRCENGLLRRHFTPQSCAAGRVGFLSPVRPCTELQGGVL